MVKVSSLTSYRSGEAVRNQFHIYDRNNGKTYFQSYNSLIAEYDFNNQKLILGCDWDYSVTTLKYLKQWMYDNCMYIYSRLPKGKSFKDSVQKAINNGLIEYNREME